jgi:hypothetical protein
VVDWVIVISREAKVTMLMEIYAKNAIIAFYENKENSRIKKDFMSVQSEEGRIHKQKHLLLSHLRELHIKWLDDNAAVERVSLSTFSAVRPK